jgi:hypothetical protein
MLQHIAEPRTVRQAQAAGGKAMNANKFKAVPGVKFEPICHLPGSSDFSYLDVYPRNVTYLVALNLNSLSRWVSTLPHVPRPWTSAPYLGGFWRCHVRRGPIPRLPVEVGSGTATCLMGPDLTSLLR